MEEKLQEAQIISIPEVTQEETKEEVLVEREWTQEELDLKKKIDALDQVITTKEV